MISRFARTLMVAATGSAVIFAAGCGDDDDDDASNPTTGPTPTTSSVGDTLAEIQAKLLTAEEVGEGFAEVPYEASDPETPSPCGTDSVPKAYPDALRTGVELDKGNELQLIEGVTLFDDEATAQAGFDLGVTGLDCADPVIEDEPITIEAPQDLTAEVGGDQALAWELTGEGFQAGLLAVKSGTYIITFTFTAPSGVDLTDAPDPTAIAKAGVAKLTGP